MSNYSFKGLSQNCDFRHSISRSLWELLWLSPQSKLLDSRYLLLVERSKCGAGRSIRALACLVWACVLPLYRNFEPITKKPLGGGSGDTSLWKQTSEHYKTHTLAGATPDEPWDQINSYLKKVWCSMQTFHSLLAALWLGSLNPIVLSNCSYWRGESTGRQREMVWGIAPGVFTLFCWRAPQYFSVDKSLGQTQSIKQSLLCASVDTITTI